MELNTLSSRIIKAAIEVHKGLGPGLLETVYQKGMALEFKQMGLKFEMEVALPVHYKGKKIDDEGFRLDLLVEDTVVIELKSVAEILPVHKKQLLTYLKLSQKPLGLLINFNEVLLKDGITRVINSSIEDG